MKTIGKGIVKTDLSYLAVIIALVCSGFFVTLATFYRIPTSTSQAIVGGVVGIGLAVNAEVDFAKFIVIAESWVICPVMVMALSFGLMHLLRLILRRFETGSFLFQNAMGWLAIGSAATLLFRWAPTMRVMRWVRLRILGSCIQSFCFLWGHKYRCWGGNLWKKVADTVGKGITPLDIPGAFVAQISSAFGMHFFSLLGIPVSTSSAIVGAVVGVGFVKGMKAISKKQ